MAYTLRHLTDQQAFEASFDLMRILRPHIADPANYVAQLLRQTAQGTVYGAGTLGQVVAWGYAPWKTCSTGALSTR